MSNPYRQDATPILFSSLPLQVLIFFILVIALIYEQPGLVFLCLLLLIIFNSARLWCSYSFAGISCHLVPDREKAFPGDKISLKAETVNHKSLPVWLELAVFVDYNLLKPDHDSNGPILNNNRSAIDALPLQKAILYGEGGLLRKLKASLNWSLQPQRRGVYEIGPFRLIGGDLFGFYRQEKYYSQTLTIIIYPRLIALNSFSLPLRELYGTPGSKSPVVDPVYPVATQDYRAGAPARHIHWKASARLGRLQEKIFEPSVQQKILIVIDVSRFSEENADASFERMLEVAASLSVQLTEQGRAFGMISNGLLIGENKNNHAALLPPGKAASQLTRLLEMLAGLQLQSGQTAISALLQAAGLSRGITCIYFNYDQVGIDSGIQAMFRRFKIPLVVIAARGPVKPGNGVYHMEELIRDGTVAG